MCFFQVEKISILLFSYAPQEIGSFYYYKYEGMQRTVFENMASHDASTFIFEINRF